MFRLDLFAITSIVAYAIVAGITIVSAPRQDLRNPAERRSMLLVVAGTLLAYASGTPVLFLAGWALTTVPIISNPMLYGRGPVIVHIASTLLAGSGLLFSEFRAGFWLLVGAVLLRKAIFPSSFWIPRAFETGSIPTLSLFLNAHLGAYLLIRHAVPLFADASSHAISMLSVLAIVTSLYGAVLGIAATKPRRILALLCTSQAAFILAGLENRNVEGISGALLHWWVVAFATTALLAVYRAVEVRTSEAATSNAFLGLGYHAPRLAVLFAVPALALVGLPGTLGFAAEDLLFHGSLESHPLLGVGLPLATALNAITVFRLFTKLFCGKRGIHATPVPDARVRERLALTVAVVVLVGGGILPAALVNLRTPMAEWIASVMAHR